jgi:hypothetical protein
VLIGCPPGLQTKEQFDGEGGKSNRKWVVAVGEIAGQQKLKFAAATRISKR